MLRRFLFFAHEGKIWRKQEEEMSHQAACLNLITNAVIVWNTVYVVYEVNHADESRFHRDTLLTRKLPLSSMFAALTDAFGLRQ